MSQKDNYNIGDLSELIDKFDNEKIKWITDFEQVQIFNALKDLEMYQKIGTIAEFMELKDKQIPKKSMKIHTSQKRFCYVCPICKNRQYSREKHCYECGQALYWREE